MPSHRKYDPKTYVPMEVDKEIIENSVTLTASEQNVTIVSAAEVGLKQITFSSMNGYLTITPAGSAGTVKWLMRRSVNNLTYAAIVIGTRYAPADHVMFWGTCRFLATSVEPLVYPIDIKTQRVLEEGDEIQMKFIASATTVATADLAANVFKKHR